MRKQWQNQQQKISRKNSGYEKDSRLLFVSSHSPARSVSINLSVFRVIFCFFGYGSSYLAAYAVYFSLRSRCNCRRHQMRVQWQKKKGKITHTRKSGRTFEFHKNLYNIQYYYYVDGVCCVRGGFAGFRWAHHHHHHHYVWYAFIFRHSHCAKKQFLKQIYSLWEYNRISFNTRTAHTHDVTKTARVTFDSIFALLLLVFVPFVFVFVAVRPFRAYNSLRFTAMLWLKKPFMVKTKIGP